MVPLDNGEREPGCKVTVTNPTDAELVRVLPRRAARGVRRASSSGTSATSTSSAIASSAITRTRATWRRTCSSARIAASKSFKGQASLGTWLYRIGVNVCLNKVGAKTPKPEALDPLLAASDERIASRDESADRGAAARRARRAGARGDRAAAEEAARDADPARVSRAAARGDRRDPRQLGRRREGELLSRAEQSEEAAGADHDDAPLSERNSSIWSKARSIRRRAAHLETCAACREQAAALARDARATRRAVDVPEPSPLFWEHFSARVRDGASTASRRRAVAGAGLRGRGVRGLVPRRGRGWRHRRRRARRAIAGARPRAADAAPSPRSPATAAERRGPTPASTARRTTNAEVWAVLTSAASDVAFEDAHDAGMHVAAGGDRSRRAGPVARRS